jgi:hypothetical protein
MKVNTLDDDRPGLTRRQLLGLATLTSGFDDGHFSEFGTFSITDWVGHTPRNVLSQHLGLPESAFASFPKSEAYILPGKVPPAV